MATLQIRMDEATLARVRGRGGSPWARDVIVEALEADGLLGTLVDEEPAAPAPTGGTSEPAPVRDDPIFLPENAVVVPPFEQTTEGPYSELCPRWMHHRKGVFCKVCGVEG